MDPKNYPPPTPPPGYQQTMQNISNEQIGHNQHQQHQHQHQQHQHQHQQHHYQHQQANMYPMQPQMPPPIVTEQVVSVIMAPHVGPDPQMITCPSCRSSVVTRVEYEPTTKTHIMAGLLCVFCCWCCVCVPYCVNSCKNGNHYCPSCGAFIGTYSS